MVENKQRAICIEVWCTDLTKVDILVNSEGVQWKTYQTSPITCTFRTNNNISLYLSNLGDRHWCIY